MLWLLRVLLLLSECVLLVTHTKVLFEIGRPYSFHQLHDRRWYFAWDLASPIAVCLATRPHTPILWALLAYHVCVHTFYIATWHTRHTRHVLHMSSGAPRAAFPWHERLWYWVGTMADIGVHALMVVFLLRSLHALL